MYNIEKDELGKQVAIILFVRILNNNNNNIKQKYKD